MEGLILLDAVCNSIAECKEYFEFHHMDYIPENHNHVTCLNMPIEAGADVNVKGKDGVTSFISAAKMITTGV